MNTTPERPRETARGSTDGRPEEGAERPGAPQLIRVGEQLVELPAGVTVADWALERVRWQNPRIRGFIYCNRVLQEVVDSNFAIRHCSEERLAEIWRRVLRVAELLRTDIRPLLASTSAIPRLDSARGSIARGLEELAHAVLSELDAYGGQIPTEGMPAFRKQLCTAIGRMYAFVQDAFGELMAADPRSRHDADYFLSRRFPRDIEEAEWLYNGVQRLLAFMQALGAAWFRRLGEVAEQTRRGHTLPSPQDWREVAALLRVVADRLTPALNEILTLRGIRFQEMEILDRCARELPTQCKVAFAIHDCGADLLDRLREGAEVQPGRARTPSAERLVQAVVATRLARILDHLNRSLLDLTAFVPAWLGNIEKRRALILAKLPEGSDGEPEAAP